MNLGNFKGEVTGYFPGIEVDFRGAHRGDETTNTVSAPDSYTGPGAKNKGTDTRHLDVAAEQQAASKRSSSQKEVDSLRMVVAPSTLRSRRRCFSRA